MTTFKYKKPFTTTVSLVLRDRASGNNIYLFIRDGKVTGATGSNPKRYLGLTEEQARHKARYANR